VYRRCDVRPASIVGRAGRLAVEPDFVGSRARRAFLQIGDGLGLEPRFSRAGGAFMNSGPLLFLGIFATLASSFSGLLLVPELQLGGQQQVTNSATLALYPANRGGSAQRGAEVFRSLGCAECHTEQVRGIGADVARWGPRKTVPQDYVGDYPVMLGSQRIGP